MRRTLCLALALAAPAAFAADWYVDGKAGSDNNTGSKSAPFLHIWRGWQMAKPGDTIHILPTVVYGHQYFGNKSGLPGAPITIQGEGASPNLTRITGEGINYAIMLDVNTNYVRIRNLDVTAPGHGNYAGWSAIYVKQSHHVEVTGNYAHDSGCAGIQIHHSDYSTVSFNRVANNARDTTNNVYCSGISQHEDLDVDTNTGVKMIIANNIVYGNTNVPLANCVYPCTDSDGNGIIIDDSRRTQTDNRAFRGATLVENNIVFNNGGRGLAIFYSDHVTARGNTFYRNNQDPYEGSWRPGEIGITFSGGINATGNVFASDGAAGTANTGAHVAVQVTDCASGDPIAVDYNLSSNPQNDSRLAVYQRNNAVPVTIGTNNRWGDPLFVQASVDPSLADFRIGATSPALGFAIPAGSYPAYDYLQVARTSPVTAGAYQQAYVPPVTAVTTASTSTTTAITTAADTTTTTTTTTATSSGKKTGRTRKA
ncbi:MAG: hypothetical protein ACTHL1_10540 [Burkholderiaceae bacterium]